MNSADLKRAKKEVRRSVLEIRDASTPQERAAHADVVAARCLELPEVLAARVVMAFWAFGSELPTMPIIQALMSAGLQVALPRIVDADLEVREWLPGDPMTQTPFGALEPTGGRVVAPMDVDVVLTPAVAFDRSGRRVGYGGGFYDRFFTRTLAARVGVGMASQVVDHDLPGGPFDLRVHAILTQDELIRTGDAR